MTIRFVVETGAGLANATSYVSASEAEDIIGLNIHALADWEALSDEDQQALLMWSTRFLDSKVQWYGNKSVTASSLRWPRTGVTDMDGIAIADNIVPDKVKAAVCEIARWNIPEDRSLPRSQDGIKQVKLSGIEIVLDSDYRQAQFPTQVRDLLRGFGFVAGGSRVSFGRVVRV